MEHDEFGSDVAGIIVAENGQLVAEDLWNGFDEGALETVSEYLQENGTTLYDLTEFPKDSVVTLRSGQTLTIEEDTDRMQSERLVPNDQTKCGQ